MLLALFAYGKQRGSVVEGGPPKEVEERNMTMPGKWRRGSVAAILDVEVDELPAR
jgi:hypothetical protein